MTPLPFNTAITGLRVKQLEQRVESLIDLISAKNTPNDMATNGTDVPPVEGDPAPPATPPPSEPPITRDSSTIIDFPPRTAPSTYQAFDPIAAGIIEAEHADRLLHIFKTSFTSSFPFVLVEADALTLRQQLPFLFHAILAVASYETPCIQFSLADEFRRQIARTIEHSCKSLEILQGLLVYAAWYHSFYYPKDQQLSIVIQLCVAFVQDLGFSRSAKKKAGLASIFHCGTPTSGVDPPAEKRAFLGTYFLTVTYAQAWRTRTTLSHTHYMAECCNSFIGSPIATDVLITPLVQLCELASRVSEHFFYDDIENSEIKGELIIQMSIHGFRKELLRIKDASLASSLAKQNTTLNLMFSFLDALLHESCLHKMRWKDASQPGRFTSSLARLDMIRRTIEASRTYLNILIETPVESLYQLTLLPWGSCFYAVILICKVVFIEDNERLGNSNFDIIPQEVDNLIPQNIDSQDPHTMDTGHLDPNKGSWDPLSVSREYGSSATTPKTAYPEPPDVLIIGSGAAALTAALRAKSQKLKPLVIEKTSLVGGTTSYSGGGLWIPNSGVHPSGTSDSFEEALKYMQNTIDKRPTKASSLARKKSFLNNGPKMVQFLKTQGLKWQPSVGYPDYFPLVEGGKTTGRSIEGKMFDLKLGDWQDKIRMTTRNPLYPMYTFEAGHMYRSMSGNVSAFLTAAKVVGWRMWSQKLLGRLPVTMGMSLVGQLLHLCLQQQIPILLDTGLKELITTEGKVRGAVVSHNGRETVISARKAVILAAGGFSRNTPMRQQHQSPTASASKTLTSPADTGDAITAAMRAGAAIELLDEAWWGPTLVDRTEKPYWAQFERALPHSLVVDTNGNRFVNEAESYTRFVHNMFKHQKDTGLGVPAFLILDLQHRSKYVLSGMEPGEIMQWALDSELYVRADTLDDLAGKLGIDSSGLRSTVQRFNDMAAKGVDEDFDRGKSPYDRFFGDPGVKPNPNLGTISKPPFYGAKMLPGDLGTKGGVLTDEYARALREDGSVVDGLYAVGNSSASVMGREYIGAGSTLGPAMTFAYVAADSIAQS
ncbi:hypothetical protein N0V83_003834 [Neocucurbitaria cava]|uniref:FAD-dependent oxidoreductase 2 FAD-binding domain-containing protein n=1 Tax=Neocucurbitaria cava TaxID=798079 RepID=A0A9W8YCK2_9PLEO|nr:hypothetical protein N0V83_003834 [Neocucurbitaria cava]